MNAAPLRIWHSPVQPAARGFEVASNPLTRHEIASTLNAIDWAQVEGGFVIFRLSPTDRQGVESAVAIAHDFASSSRICVALDAATLTRVNSKQLTSDRVGLVLDDVDTETALTVLIHDAIEAVRFGVTFIDRALTNLRQEAVLRAMLSLSRDLGLGTLGPMYADDTRALDFSQAFDYVSQPIQVSVSKTEPQTGMLRGGASTWATVRVS